MSKKECAICGTPITFSTTRYQTLDKSVICSNCGKLAKLNSFTSQSKTIEEIKELMGDNGASSNNQRIITSKFNEIYPGTISSANKKSINKLAQHLKSGEEVIYIFCGNTKVPALGLVTNERLILIENGVFNTGAVTEIPLNKINSVSFSKGVVLSTLKVVNAYGELLVKNIQNKLIDEIIKQIRTAMDNFNEIKEVQKVNNPDFSNFDEIKKFKELLDSGIITEDEFNIKKKELLNL